MDSKGKALKQSTKDSIWDVICVAGSCGIGVLAGLITWHGFFRTETTNVNHNQEKITHNKAKDDNVLRNKSIDYHFRYIDEFLLLGCSRELLSMKIFPDGKEITESFAVYNAIRKHLNSEYFGTNISNVTAVVIGDGSTPRIGSVLCYRTRWNQVVSCDPMMKTHENYQEKIRNLTLIKNKIENVSINCKNNNIVVICMHAHVDIQLSLNSLCFDTQNNCQNVRIAVIACPCCKWTDLQKRLYNTRPDLTYKDISLCSEMNTIHIWKNCTKLILQDRQRSSTKKR